MVQKSFAVSVINTVRKIWDSQSNMVTLMESNGRLYAECEFTMDRRRLTEENYEEILNDMFYDYCVENADYMGVS
jgi:hypothetical protein